MAVAVRNLEATTSRSARLRKRPDMHEGVAMGSISPPTLNGEPLASSSKKENNQRFGGDNGLPMRVIYGQFQVVKSLNMFKATSHPLQLQHLPPAQTASSGWQCGWQVSHDQSRLINHGRDDGRSSHIMAIFKLEMVDHDGSPAQN